MTRLMRQCLDAIAKHQALHGVPPSFEELRKALKLSSKGQVSKLIERMAERGLVAFERGKARSLRILISDDQRDAAVTLLSSCVAQERSPSRDEMTQALGREVAA